MRVEIDKETCTGHGRCYTLVPELFDDDDQGFGRVIDRGEISVGRRDHARRAVQTCPEGAVRLVDD